MPSIFDKLNLTTQKRIVVLNAPESFEPELASLGDVEVARSVERGSSFWLAFVIRQEELDLLARAIAAQAEGDAIVWFAFVKGSSKRYKSEITRDKGWEVLRELGFDTVRSVAIDADWSALRFRRVEFIGK
jgi:hypothetical protein